MKLILRLVISLILINASDQSISIDCHPDANATEEKCVSRGCVWIPKSIQRAPWCEFGHSDDPNAMAGYDVEKQIYEGRKYTAKLKRRETPTLFGDDFQTAVVRIDQITSEIMRIFIIDQKHTAREAIYPKWRKHVRASDHANSDPDLDIRTEANPFGFAIVRKTTGIPLVDTRRIPGFTFALQYLQISMKIPSQYLYGLGEDTRSQLKHDFQYRSWGLFTKDRAIGDPGFNLFGAQPFYLCFDDQQNAHGVLFLNTHAMNIVLQPDPSDPDRGVITWRSIGGALDFFVFSGPTPDDVIRQYTNIVGKPLMPPYWALGFQLSRWGYSNLTYLEKVLDRNRLAQIPLDTQVMDLDYFYKRMDFTVDPVAFRNFSSFIRKLHDEYKMKIVIIIDPSIASRPSITYRPLNEGLRMNVFVKDNRTGRPLEGRVWPGETYFVDFTNPNSTIWWTKMFKEFHTNQSIDYDGIWIDMNEPSNFVHGSLTGCAENRLNKPPYNPLIYSNINEMTLCMDSDHFMGKHYELHNLYSYTEARSTYKALKAVYPGKRVFILSRSTFSGSGKYTNHWTGDDASTWPQLKYSIVTTLEFGMYGMPLMGADICGFHEEATEELCLRWHQMGAFYPFCRNHNDIGSKRDQDPAAWSPNVTAVIRNAFMIRYTLLPYLYTLLHGAHTNGTPVAKPLFFQYPNDTHARIVDDQFLWGDGLMIAPVITQGSLNRSVYFPRDRWYDLLKFDEIPRSNEGRILNIQMPLDTVGLYIRGGAIMPSQDPAMTTTLSRRNKMNLIIGLDENSRARGSLYWDDGESEDGPNSRIQFEAWNSGNQGGIHINAIKYDYEIQPNLDTVFVHGIRNTPKSVKLDGSQLSPKQIIADHSKLMLSIHGLGMKFEQSHEIVWQF